MRILDLNNANIWLYCRLFFSNLERIKRSITEKPNWGSCHFWLLTFYYLAFVGGIYWKAHSITWSWLYPNILRMHVWKINRNRFNNFSNNYSLRRQGVTSRQELTNVINRWAHINIMIRRIIKINLTLWYLNIASRKIILALLKFYW